MATNYNFLYPGERVLLEGNVSMQQFAVNTFNGHLILSDKRLIFLYQTSGGVNYGDIPFNTISVIGDSYAIFPALQNMFLVTVITGNVYGFVVPVGQRDVWVQRICEAASQLRSMSYNGSSEYINRYATDTYSANNAALQPAYAYEANNSQPVSATSNFQQPTQKPKKKNKVARIVVGILFLISGLIWVVSDGISGANKSDEWFQGSSSADEEIIIKGRILTILDQKQFQPPLAPSILDVANRTFSHCEVTIEQKSENSYYVTFEGTVKINVVAFPGSVKYLVDLDSGSCGPPQYTGECQNAMMAALTEMLY